MPDKITKKATFSLPVTLLASVRKLCKMTKMELNKFAAEAFTEKQAQLLKHPSAIAEKTEGKIKELLEDIEKLTDTTEENKILHEQIADLTSANEALQKLVKEG